MGSFWVETGERRTKYSGSIRHRSGRRGGDDESLRSLVVSAAREIVAVSDTRDAIENLDLEGFGTAEDGAQLRSVLLEHIEVFSPDTGTVPGEEFRTLLKPNIDLSKLN
jgi:hypothetical protein